MKRLILLLLLAGLAVRAGIDLVTLPERDRVQLTIYNSADLTLVRDVRSLTLKQGLNRLQFSWANTLIDPTSLSMAPLAHAGEVDVLQLLFPPRTKDLGLWQVTSGVSGEVPMEITCFTSGLSWRAFYMGTLSPDEATMRLQGYVVVSNQSGEDYANAATRLVVGKVHLLDQIAALARRQPPYGSPVPPSRHPPRPQPTPAPMPTVVAGALAELEEVAAAPSAAKEVKKEGLSEYFLYSIEGEETIPNQWRKRLISFTADEIPVVNLYKYDEERYGQSVRKFLSFQNKEEDKLGETPIPGGSLRLYRMVDEVRHLRYEGASSFKYIPVGEDVELDFGAAADVIVEPTLMTTSTTEYMFDDHKRIIGWDDVGEWRVVVRNTRDLPVKIEVTRSFPTPHWDLANEGDGGKYEKIDLDTVRYTLELPPRSSRTFGYTVTLHQGRRAE